MKSFTVEVTNCSGCPYCCDSTYVEAEFCAIFEGPMEEAIDLCTDNAWELTDSCPMVKS